MRFHLRVAVYLRVLVVVHFQALLILCNFVL